MKEIKTIICEAEKLAYTILKYQKFGYTIDYVYPSKSDKYELQISRLGQVV